MIEFISILWKLLAAHAVTDCLLQDWKINSIAIKKRRIPVVLSEQDQEETNEYKKPNYDWPYWLWSHACLNGLGVYWATGNPLLGLAESVAHSIIDFLKCEGFYGLHVDQALHLSCKILWVVIILWK